jgi:hypothetical protein
MSSSKRGGIKPVIRAGASGREMFYNKEGLASEEKGDAPSIMCVSLLIRSMKQF